MDKLHFKITALIPILLDRITKNSAIVCCDDSYDIDQNKSSHHTYSNILDNLESSYHNCNMKQTYPLYYHLLLPLNHFYTFMISCGRENDLSPQSFACEPEEYPIQPLLAFILIKLGNGNQFEVQDRLLINLDMSLLLILGRYFNCTD